VKEYQLCQLCLEKMAPVDQRRMAEVCFKKAVVLQMMDQPEEALACCNNAIRGLKVGPGRGCMMCAVQRAARCAV
jgi:hypothetical protein